MEEMDEFYLTIPSWGSMNYHPGNTASDFYTQLAKPIYLTSANWKMALAEFTTLKTWYNIDNEACTVSFDVIEKKWNEEDQQHEEVGRDRFIGSIPIGVYDNIETLVLALNNITYKSNDPAIPGKSISSTHFVFEYDLLLRRMQIRFLSPYLEIYLQNDLGYVLGFISGKNSIVEQQHAPHVVNMDGLKTSVLVHCNLVQEQYVGHNLVQVLDYIFTGTHSFGQIIHHNFDPKYLKVAKRTVEVVHIWVTDSQYNLVPFHSGESIVKLHFVKG
jgi:hypothetical protein